MSFVHGNIIWKSPRNAGGVFPLNCKHSLRYKSCFERGSPDFIKRVPFLSMKAKDSSARGSKVSFAR